MKSSIIEYDYFVSELEKAVYKNARSDLINKISKYPDRYVGIFRPTSPKQKLIQNITQSHEISFGDFIEDIITQYLGHFYKNYPKNVIYNDNELQFDQLFEYNNCIYMVEQKMRDDHDSSKKRGQFNNFVEKAKYLRRTYPNQNIVAIMWFVDSSLHKNRNFYQTEINNTRVNNTNFYLFYGSEFTAFLDKVRIWDEMEEYLLTWRSSEENSIELNFEKNWAETKKELKDFVPKKNWKRIVKNEKVIKQIFPILFPKGKYKEILDELQIKY